jgi:hypothetical protein
MGETITIHCDRCGRAPRDDEPLIPNGPPHGWEGPPPVCPGCQYAEWHPHCTSWFSHHDPEGERVSWADSEGDVHVAPHLLAIPHDEWDSASWFECDEIDLTVSWTGGDDLPQGWWCPRCGNTDFEGVHRDYGQSGLAGATFEPEFELEDDEEEAQS